MHSGRSATRHNQQLGWPSSSRRRISRGWATPRTATRGGDSRPGTGRTSKNNAEQSEKEARLEESRAGESLAETFSDAIDAEESMLQQIRDAIRLTLPHIVLIMSTAVYAIVGAFIFIAIEQPHELQSKQFHIEKIRRAQHAFWLSEMDKLNVSLNENLDELIYVVFEAFEEGIRPSDVSTNITLKWNDFSSAVFFTTTMLTSIGYGSLVPASQLGRLFCIAYALFGIPLTLVTIADVAKFLSDLVTGPLDEEPPPSWSGPMVLCVLLTYMTVAAVIFAIIETSWNFLDSFYFCLITLVTVGFGDLVPLAENLVGSIAFIFVGLILTTLAVDVFGSACIDRMHAWGRSLDALGFLQALRHPRRAEFWYAFVPKDAEGIPYIDASQLNMAKEPTEEYNKDDF